MYRKLLILFVLGALLGSRESKACSVLYYIDPVSGKIFAASNEDYRYDVKASIRIIPASKKELARLWYGWDDFAQGGINEAGLFFDGAVSPEQDLEGMEKGPEGNLGDDLLASCRTVEEVLLYLDMEGIALNNAHMMFGDRTGNAVVVEWLDGERKVVSMLEDRLVMTNFLLSDPSRGNYPCPRYEAIQDGLNQVEAWKKPVDLKVLGNIMAGAVQLPRTDEEGHTGGTLYTTFINISDMEFVLVYKLDMNKITRLDLEEVFAEGKKTKIRLE